VRDDLSLSEYIVLLAEAFDAEELDRLKDHNLMMGIAVGLVKPKKLPKWKWSSIDKAGTAPIGRGTTGVAQSIAGMAMIMSKGELEASPSTYIYERAKATGRRLIYMDEEMNYYDEHGNSIDREKDDLIVRISTKDH
jgi:hypothetical protein